MTDEREIDGITKRALAGDRGALESLTASLQGDIHALALRMLWNRHDAEDATQEILVRIITRLSTFDFRSRLRTWAFRVAVNYLLDVKKSAVEQMNLRFDRLSEDLLDGISSDGPAENERAVLVEEVKIGCTFAMLQCLDRPTRLAYILGEILDLSGPEAADALGIEPEVFRKRLERAREAVTTFVQRNCGIVSDDAVCSCPRRVANAIRLGRVQVAAPQFAGRSISFQEIKATVRAASDARRVLELHRSNHPREPTVDLTRLVLAAIDATVAGR
jgi:RNA polymerase sigma factor (sigma-70 family)